jgi:hypothetical protein
MLNDLSPAESAAALACTPDAIPAPLLQRWMQTGTQVYAAIEEVQELVDGYACRLPSDAKTLGMVAEYIGLDRLCCPFIRWTLEIEPDGGPLWLGIKGGEDVKALIRESFETMALLRERTP